ncbi:MAG: hypothetical protein ABEI78_02020 [Candidatus Nanohaloarchaea archaeon]
MEFSLDKVGDENLYYFESNKDSSIQLIFTSGGLNPDIWKHQLKYFSKEFKTVSYQPLSNKRSFEEEKKVLNEILDSKNFDNAILVSHFLGNGFNQEFEQRDDVLAQVFTSVPKRLFDPPKTIFNNLWKLAFKQPKLCQKIFFNNKTSYQVVKEFIKDIDKPEFYDFKSFSSKSSLRSPLKRNLIIYPKKDLISSKSEFDKIKTNSEIAYLNNAGTFCFYERPEDYNKALIDFLSNIKNLARRRDIMKARKKNKSLEDYNREKVEISQ